MADRLKVSTESLLSKAQELMSIQDAITDAEEILSGINLSNGAVGDIRLSMHGRLRNGAVISGNDVATLIPSLCGALNRVREDSRQITKGVLRAAELFEETENGQHTRLNGPAAARLDPNTGKLPSWFRHTRLFELLQLLMYYQNHPDPGIEAEKARDAQLRQEVGDLFKNSEGRDAWDNASLEERKKILEGFLDPLNALYGTSVASIDYFYSDPLPTLDDDIADVQQRLKNARDELAELERQMEEYQKRGSKDMELLQILSYQQGKLQNEITELEKVEAELVKQREINSIITMGEYDDPSRQVRLNERSIQELSYEEMMEVLAHEMRHAYQHEAIRRPGDFTVSKDTVIAWQKNFSNYIDPRKEPQRYDEYRRQPVEEDAFGFSKDIARG